MPQPWKTSYQRAAPPIPRPLQIPRPPVPMSVARPTPPPNPMRRSCGFCGRVRKLLGIAP